MPVLVTEHLGIDPIDFAKTGAFDSLLDMDSLLFIDPALLRRTRAPELAQSADRVSSRFQEIMRLLHRSKERGDVFWMEAAKRFRFPEVRGLAFGYAKKGTGGSGMGPALRDSLLETAKAIVDAGIEDPAFFELVGLFQENVGPDRVCDMIARIISADLHDFTYRVFRDLDVIGDGDDLPTNPYNGAPVLLAPLDVLRELPVAESLKDVGRAILINAEVRDSLNKIVGRSWKELLEIPKPDLRRLLLENPELLRKLIDEYKSSKAEPYDTVLDENGRVRWLNDAKQIANAFPLSLNKPSERTLEQLEEVVLTICRHFKRLIEDNGVNKSLYVKGKELPEDYLQRIFFVAADIYCGLNDIDVTPEANSGVGPVDFKFSAGYKLRILVETKKSTNSHLLRGLAKQLPMYTKAEKALRAIYLVVDVGASEAKLKSLREAFEKAPNPPFRLIMVDGLLYPSASKA